MNLHHSPFLVKHEKWEIIIISGFVREILSQSLIQKLSSKNIINEADLSNTHVVILILLGDGGVIRIQN